MSPDGFGILFVCYANLCRSPLAELLARRAFDDTFGVAPASQVSTASAGLRGFDGSAMHQHSAAVLAECGITPDGFVSRTVTPALLRNADLILTASREQRSACLAMEPAAVRRAFTLRQFARFAAVVPPVRSGSVAERMRGLVQQVNDERHLVPAVPGDQDDLADPVNQPIEAFRVCAEEVWQSLRTVVGVIAAA